MRKIMMIASFAVLSYSMSAMADETKTSTDEILPDPFQADQAAKIEADIAYAKANFPDESERWQKDWRNDSKDESYRQMVLNHVTAEMAKVSETTTPQFFIFIDRNPKRQNLLVAFWDGTEVTEIGWSKVSTGDPRRIKYSKTPTGTYPIVRLGYRAEGTKNAGGWMGLGKKDSRIWSFGEVDSTGYKGIKTGITMLMHATDPTYGEPRLGRPDSKGCIRISALMNAYLDIYGILDKHILEKESPARQKRLLREDRQPVKNYGLYAIIADFPPDETAEPPAK